MTHGEATSFPDEVRADLLQAVEAAVDERVRPRAAEIDESKEFPDDIRQLWAELGLLGLSIPERFGGSGAPIGVSIDVVRRIARVCANSANVVTHQALAACSLVLAGTDEQRSRWLPQMAAGEALGAFGLTESGAGSDNRGIRTTARRVGDQYVVSGTKIFCTWGSIAQVLTVFARVEDEPGSPEFAAIVIDLPDPNVVVDRIETKMGLNGSPTAQITLHDVVVPVENRLPGDGLRIALETLNSGRVEVGSLALGIAEGAIAYASSYLEDRTQFGQPLADFQALRFKIADHLTSLEAAALLLHAAGRACDAGSRDRIRLSAMAKLFATDAAMHATSDAVNLLGGYGYMKDFPVERMMRDAKVMQIVEGTNEIQRVVIANRWFSTPREQRLGESSS